MLLGIVLKNISSTIWTHNVSSFTSAHHCPLDLVTFVDVLECMRGYRAEVRLSVHVVNAL